jgi:hypothetical protein
MGYMGHGLTRCVSCDRSRVYVAADRTSEMQPSSSVFYGAFSCPTDRQLLVPMLAWLLTRHVAGLLRSGRLVEAKVT